MTGADVVAILVSLVALAFSIYAWIRGFGITKRLAAIEEARRDEELTSRQSASVTVRLRKDPSSTAIERKLLLVNEGRRGPRL
jgi:hypothetical protein